MTIHPKTRESYSKKADLYFEEEGDELPLIASEVVQQIMPNLEGLSVLSVGCGAGRELLSLKEMGATSVVAIEPSDFLRLKAIERCPFAKVLDGEIELIPLQDVSVDFIYCSHVLHYLRDWQTALHQLKRVLKPSGKLLVTLHHPLDWGLVHCDDSARLLGHKHSGQELGNYLASREIEATWYGAFEVVHYSRSIGTSITEFLEAGFTLSAIREGSLSDTSDLPLYFALLLQIQS